MIRSPVAAQALSAPTSAALAAFGVPGGLVSPNYIRTASSKNDVDQFDARVDRICRA